MNFIFALLLPLIFTNDNYKTELKSILNKIPNSTKTSILVYNPNTLDTLFQKNIYKSRIPASNTKLFTTATALSLMGGNKELSTTLFTDDIDLTDSVIDGNLYIKGFGNSLFKEKDLDSLVNEVLNLGIKKITGSVIGDDSYFDNIYYRDDWITNERANVSVPPVSALVLNNNKMIIHLYSKGNVGNPLTYNLTPKMDFSNVTMNAKVTSKRRRPRISSSFKEDGFYFNVKGGLRKRRRARSYAIFIDKPTLYCSFLLHSKLNEKEIVIEGNPTAGITPMLANEIASSRTSIKEIIKLINKNSDNFLAECLFKTIGAEFSGEQGNSFYATQSVLTFIDENNIYDEGTAVVDGSGISRHNEITVAAIGGLLEAMYFDDNLFNDFYNSLTISSVDRTLKDRFIGKTSAKRFRGKTGYLNGVTTLSGYLFTKQEEDLIISIMFEFRKKGASYHKDIQEEIIQLFYDKF